MSRHVSRTDQELLIDVLHQDLGVPSQNFRTGDSKKSKAVRKTSDFVKQLTVKLNQSVNNKPNTDEIEKLRRAVLENPSRRTMLTALTQETLDKFWVPCTNIIIESFVNDSDKLEAFARFCVNLTNRMKVIRKEHIEEHAKRLNDKSELPFQVVLQVIRFGIENTAHTSWSAFEVIPTVFQEDRGRLPNLKEFNKICDSVHDFIGNLADSQDHVFHAILGQIRGKNGLREPWAPYRKEFFTITEELSLTLKPKVFRYAKRNLQSLIKMNGVDFESEPRVGCPSKPLISFVHLWCLTAAKKFMYQAMEF